MYHGDEVRRSFSGECWAALPDNDPGQHAEAIEKYGLRYVTGASGVQGLQQTKWRVSFGANSGYQAIHLAYHLGARRILLLGYDYGGRTGSHWFGQHPTPLRSGHDYNKWLLEIRILAQDLAAAGVEVINLTRHTAIDCFPRMSLESSHSD